MVGDGKEGGSESWGVVLVVGSVSSQIPRRAFTPHLSVGRLRRQEDGLLRKGWFERQTPACWIGDKKPATLFLVSWWLQARDKSQLKAGRLCVVKTGERDIL